MQKIYGKTDPELTFTLTGAVGSDVVTFNGQIIRKTGESVGSYGYEIGSVTLDSEWSTNYTICSTIEGSFEIVCAVIKIKIKDQTEKIKKEAIRQKEEIETKVEDTTKAIAEKVSNVSITGKKKKQIKEENEK